MSAVLQFVFAAALLGPGPTEGATDAGSEIPDPAASTTIVFLQSASPTDSESKLYEAASQQASGVGLRARSAPPSKDAPLARAIELSREQTVLGVFWLSPRNQGIAIYLYEPRGKGVFVREIERSAGETDAALVEAVSLAIASTAAALQQGNDLFMTPLDAERIAALLESSEAKPQPPTEPAPEPEPEPEPQPQPEPAGDETPTAKGGVGLRLFAAYLGDGFNGDAPWQSGAQAGLSLLAHPLVRIGLGYGFLAPARLGDSPSMRLTRHEIALDVAVGGAVGKRVELHGVVVGALDLGVWSSESESGLAPLARLGPMLAVGVRVTGGLFFDLAAGAVFGLNRAEFVLCDARDVACDEDNRSLVARSWPVAPRLTAGFSYRFEGLGRAR